MATRKAAAAALLAAALLSLFHPADAIPCLALATAAAAAAAAPHGPHTPSIAALATGGDDGSQQQQAAAPGALRETTGPRGHARSPELLKFLVDMSDWILDGNRSGICLRTNRWCPGYHPNNGSWAAPSCDDWGNYVTGNLARTLLAAHKLTGNATYLAEGLAWCDTLCSLQRNVTSAVGSPAGFWPDEIYIADTGTAVTALAYAVHLADTPWRKRRYVDVLTRYASWVLEGCDKPPGKTTDGKRVIGLKPHPYSWVTPDGPDRGSMGDGYWNGTLNDAPYTIATATTGGAFFAEMLAVTGNATYGHVATGAVGWLLRYRAANGANVYRFNHPGPYPPPYKGADTLTETTTYPTEAFVSVDRHVPGIVNTLAALNTTVRWVLSMQDRNGSLGVPMTPGGERATRIASLLQWASLRLGQFDPATEAAASRGVDLWVDYILAKRGAWETGVTVYGLPTGFVGLAVADLVQPWVTWTPAAAGDLGVPELRPPVTNPSRDRVFDVREFGAVGDNTTLDTAAVRAAAAAVSHAGGGTLLFPAGSGARPYMYLTGAFNVSSHTTVVIERHAAVVGSPRAKDWPFVDPLQYMGWGSMHQGLIYAVDAVNVTLTGGGTVDGRDQRWYPARGAPVQCAVPPCAGVHLVLVRNSTGVVVENLTLVRARYWALHLAWVTDLRVRSVTVDIEDGDGIDLSCVNGAVVEHCSFKAHNDAIGVKSGIGAAGRRFGRPTRDVVFQHCQAFGGHGIAIGDEVAAGIFNVTFSDIFLNGSYRGPWIKSKPEMGGFVDRVTYRDIVGVGMGGPPPSARGRHSLAAGVGWSTADVWHDIEINLDWVGSGSTANVTRCSNVMYDNVTISGGPGAGVFLGTATAAVANVSLRNVRLGGLGAAFSNCSHVLNGSCVGRAVTPCPPCFARRPDLTGV